MGGLLSVSFADPPEGRGKSTVNILLEVGRFSGLGRVFAATAFIVPGGEP